MRLIFLKIANDSISGVFVYVFMVECVSTMKILIAEDDPTSSFLLERALTKQGYETVVARDGQEAFEFLQGQVFDAVLTDWMMPRMDGITLVRKIRENIHPTPLIMVVTALAMPEARAHALDSGADDYITKPYVPRDVISALENCMNRRFQAMPELPPLELQQAVVSRPAVTPPFPAVGMTFNTGGPVSVGKYFKGVGRACDAAFLVVFPAPLWAQEMFAMRLQQETGMRVSMAEDGMTLLPRRIYIARKDRHMIVEPKSFKIRLEDGPPRNFCRPSADVLFESMAEAFGAYTVSVALSGMGKDGLTGFSALAASGGSVLAQDPAMADAPYLPQAVSELGICKAVQPAEALGGTTRQEVDAMAARLTLRKENSGAMRE